MADAPKDQEFLVTIIETTTRQIKCLVKAPTITEAKHNAASGKVEHSEVISEVDSVLVTEVFSNAGWELARQCTKPKSHNCKE